MTALRDIGAGLKSAGPVPPGKKRFVLVGRSAMYSIRTETKGFQKPTTLDGYPVVETEDFPGWAVVDKPVPKTVASEGIWPKYRG